MDYIDLLLKQVKDKSVYSKLKFGHLTISIKRDQLTAEVLNLIMSKIINTIKKYPSINISVEIDFGNAKFTDKLSYIYFECILYMIFKNYDIKINIKFKNRSSIITGGLSYSPLLRLMSSPHENYKLSENEKVKLRDTYLTTFETNQIFRHHYRVLVKHDSSSDVFCKIMSDIKTFFSVFVSDESFRSDVADVIIELAGNAYEHTKSDCLIDIDVCRNFYRIDRDENDESNNYMGINIAIVNFSTKILGDGIKAKILSKNTEHDSRYEQVKEAYQVHKKYFDDRYNEEAFYILCSFQDKITERKEDSTGGRGLTKLIKALEDKSDEHSCYVISGKNVLYFIRDYLEYNENGWIGFNEENDFLNCVPYDRVLASSPFFPGTAFNFNFIIQEGENNEQCN